MAFEIRSNAPLPETIEFSPWYPKTLPEEVVASTRGSMSTQSPSDLNNQVFDLVIVGAGVAGTSAALRAAQLAAREPNRKKPLRILLMDKDRVFSGLSSISGGLFTGLEIDSEWLASGIGREACDEFNRRIYLAIANVRGQAHRFEAEYEDLGVKVITAPEIALFVDAEEHLPWVQAEVEYIQQLFGHDVTNHRERLLNEQLSLKSLAGAFQNISSIRRQDLPGNYADGFVFPGEFSENPAMLDLMMRTLLVQDFGPNVDLRIAENLRAEDVHPDTGKITCADARKDEISVTGKKILLAGAPRELIHTPKFKRLVQQNPAAPYRTLIAVTHPLSPELQAKFNNRAFHDSSKEYRYGWMDPSTGRLVLGHSDSDVFPGMSVDEMKTASAEAVQACLGQSYPLEHIWAGDIPNSMDGIAHVHRQGCVLWTGHAGGRSLAANCALAMSAVEALLYKDKSVFHGQREDEFLRSLEQRKDGYSADTLAQSRPEYLQPAPFILKAFAPPFEDGSGPDPSYG